MNQNLIADVGRILKGLIISDPFYGVFLSTIRKEESTQIPWAAVSVNKATLDFSLIINPLEWFKLSDATKKQILKHEALHLCFFHLLTMDNYPNHLMDNFATDLEINQYVDYSMLPKGVLLLHEFQQKYPDLDFSANKGRAHYYKELSKLPKEEQEKLGLDQDDNTKHNWIIIDGEGNPTDKLSEAEKDVIQSQIESTMANIAEEVSKSAGNVPVEINGIIKNFKKPKPHFDYKKYIRNFIGSSTKYQTKATRSIENQRFEGQPKIILRPKQKILVLVDESGSVNETSLMDFMNEIYHLGKKMDVEIRPFDTSVGKEVKMNHKDATIERSRCGGTYLEPCIDYFDERKDIDTCIVFTDGYFSPCRTTRKNLLIVIDPDGTMDSVTNHKQVIKIPKND